MSVLIPLSRGQFAIIDEADRALVEPIRWSAAPCNRSNGGFYAVNGRGGAKPTKNGKRYMHRLIVGATDGQLVDHINGNGLDNRRSNLRLADYRANCINRHYQSRSGFRGVHANSQSTWRAIITSHGKPRRLGSFASAFDAAVAYDLAAIELHGEFAVLNFPHPRTVSAAA